MFDIRDEAPWEGSAREALLDRAFGLARFEKTSERLREGRAPAIALSALDVSEDADGEGNLAGTVRLWNVATGDGRPALLLGPLAVDASYRGTGLGGRLMRWALNRAAIAGHGAVILVGDAPYYERFGFSAELTEGLDMPGPVERHRFLGLELSQGALAGARGCLAATGRISSLTGRMAADPFTQAEGQIAMKPWPPAR
ncbi:N-acetyltransferase [Stappia sp. F7233]|uniref:N-acetyltransferase n=1 Tax=Stappia albiluteola TaxID=2758565 RepID=A0A839AHB2_9HYPH|nr:N-acetyltransferase [Stappia albiluteola]MBA5779101.1 N-acetyltransferase [Stappia albiluteola]